MVCEGHVRRHLILGKMLAKGDHLVHWSNISSSRLLIWQIEMYHAIWHYDAVRWKCHWLDHDAQ